MTKQQSFKKAQQSLGYTNKEMAEVLGLGLKSIEGYRARNATPVSKSTERTLQLIARLIELGDREFIDDLARPSRDH